VPPRLRIAVASQFMPEYFVLHELPINLRRGRTAAACATLLLQAVAVIRAKTRANDAQRARNHPAASAVGRFEQFADRRRVIWRKLLIPKEMLP
jgi:hypothetical protein